MDHADLMRTPFDMLMPKTGEPELLPWMFAQPLGKPDPDSFKADNKNPSETTRTC